MIVSDGHIVTCDPQETVVRGDIVIRNGRILAIGPDARRRAHASVEIVDASGCAIIPGLIQTHVHVCQTLMRGMGEDLPLLTWLQKRVWPLEAAHDERSLHASAELSLAELVLGGTTTILDMGSTHGYDVILDACLRFGIRVFGGKVMMDRGRGVPGALRESTKASLAQSDALCAHWDGANHGRIRYAYAPRFILSCSERLIRETVERMQAGSFLHVHAAEHGEEKKAVRRAFGADDVDVLSRWGAKGLRCVLAHGVQLTARQVRSVAAQGTRVVHCPSANLKLGSGIAPLDELMQAGVAVGIGADGAACNNNLDAWMEMRLAGLLAKLRKGPARFSAQQALNRCTIEGARVLHLEQEIGSLEVGKRADLLIISLNSFAQTPVVNVVDTLVFASGAQHVRDVMADGKWLVRNRELLGHDADKIMAEARNQAKRLRQKAGLA